MVAWGGGREGHTEGDPINPLHAVVDPKFPSGASMEGNFWSLFPPFQIRQLYTVFVKGKSQKSKLLTI